MKYSDEKAKIVMDEGMYMYCSKELEGFIVYNDDDTINGLQCKYCHTLNSINICYPLPEHGKIVRMED